MSLSKYSDSYGGKIDGNYDRSMQRLKAIETLECIKKKLALRKEQTVAVHIDQHTVYYTTANKERQLRERLEYERRKHRD